MSDKCFFEILIKAKAITAYAASTAYNLLLIAGKLWVL